MFEFTIREKDLLNSIKNELVEYVNKSYKFTMSFISNPTLAKFRENERLILIAVNKSVYQNLYSFFRLNETNMQYAAFACLENSVYAMRLYNILAANPNYMHDFITKPDFSLDVCEYEISEKQKEYVQGIEEFSLKEFYNGIHKVNTFELKNSSISTQLIDNNVYLGLSCGKEISDELQHEVRKNLIGAYLSINKHTKMFFNGGIDKELEELEDSLYSKFLEYVKRYTA